MKKFMLGLICGVALTASTAVYASNAIQAVLFPTNVTFDIDGNNQRLNQADLINFNDKAYIPLRLFAETIGATVIYTDPQKSLGNQRNIEIYYVNERDFSLGDPDGYLSFAHVEYSIGGSNPIISGTIMLNKEMQPENWENLGFEVYDEAENLIAKSHTVIFGNPDAQHNPNNLKLNVGDNISFMAFVEKLAVPTSDKYSIKVPSLK